MASGIIFWEAAIIKRFEHGGNVYADTPSSGWLDFSANINPLGLSPRVYAELLSHLNDIVHYPDPAARELKEAISKRYSLPSDCLVLGNGATELFYLLMQALRPESVLIPVPSFSEYERAASAVGATIIFFQLQESQGFAIDFSRLLEHAVLERPEMIILGNPNNPTGNLISSAALQEFLYKLKCTLGTCRPWIVIDESFLDFREDEALYTARQIEDDRLVVIQSLTKFYALPGLRLGFGVAKPRLVEQLEMRKDVWNVNLLAQRAGIAALKDSIYARKTIATVAHEAKFLYNELASLPFLKPSQPTVNFILCKLSKGTGKELARGMKAKGILIRDCANYPGLDDSYIRLAVRTHDENMRLLNMLKEIGRSLWSS